MNTKVWTHCDLHVDSETAASAVRNLNDVEVGGRPLRLDFAEVDPMLDSGDRAARSRTPGGLPPMPSGVMPPPGVPSTDVITRTIASLPPHQLIDILTQMKSLTANAPEQARSLLTANPQLAYAVFHAMLMMNVVDPMVVRRVMGDTGMNPTIPPAAPPSVPMMPTGPPPASHAMANPPVPMEPSAPTPAPPQPPQLDEQQRMLLQQVLQLTPEQINALPPDQRAGILQLKAQFGH